MRVEIVIYKKELAPCTKKAPGTWSYLHDAMLKSDKSCSHRTDIDLAEGVLGGQTYPLPET